MVAIHQLRKLDCDVTTVGNGIEVLDALDKETYDMILMDCQMPLMDGYEATAQIRKRTGADRVIKIVALTANALAGERETCIQAGMDGYLSKPFRAEDLRAIMDEMLGG